MTSSLRILTRWTTSLLLVGLGAALVIPGSELAAQSTRTQRTATRPAGLKVGRFPVDVHSGYGVSDGLPSEDVRAIAVLPSGDVYAGTAKGLSHLEGGRWVAVSGTSGPVTAIAPASNGLWATTADGLDHVKGNAVDQSGKLPDGAHECVSLQVLDDATIVLASREALFRGGPGAFNRDAAFDAVAGKAPGIRRVAAAADGRMAVAADAGLFLLTKDGWSQPNPVQGDRSWLPRNVGAVGFDSKGRLWFGSRQGVGVLDAGKWTLYTGDDGLPYNDFTSLATGANGTVWFGTTKGAIRFDGENWNYREGRGWLPDDHVRQVAISADKTAWFATKAGVGKIEPRMMTLAEKARFFEDEIDKYHRRTPYEYVDSVGVVTPGKKDRTIQHDDDNDGLWTAMYGAGEAFAYGATKDPKAKERAKKAFHALRFLSQVTQGGEHPAPKGFPARSILPTSGRDPNSPETIERDRRAHRRDPLWKVIIPRWPKSADGKWYWKSDTSSDELDGHYFCYAAYYDLVAETEEEKREARELIAAVTDHLIEHDFNLVDHDGQPTRWAVYGPKEINLDPRWASDRGLKSLSILSYLRVALHATGDKKYDDAFKHLVENGYLNNLETTKVQSGPETGNHSDDEMAFMCYYNLLKYESDPIARAAGSRSLAFYWTFLEQPERNPLFNYIFAASVRGSGSTRGGIRGGARGVPASCLAESLDQLERFPLDRFNWAHTNSQRIDIVPLAFGRFGRRDGPRGHLHSGRTLSIEERFFDHWNHDPWRLNTGGDGHELADGAVFLLPYYLGLYHQFIVEEPESTAHSSISRTP